MVWIDGGLHASEVSSAQSQIQIVYEMLSKSDPETMRLLSDDVTLFVLPNPDGQQLVADFTAEDNVALAVQARTATSMRWWRSAAHDTALRDIYEKLLPLLSPSPEPPRRQIGFSP